MTKLPPPPNPETASALPAAQLSPGTPVHDPQDRRVRWANRKTSRQLRR
jgi:hypothetical protein